MGRRNAALKVALLALPFIGAPGGTRAATVSRIGGVADWDEETPRPQHRDGRSNERKAVAVLKALETGDTEAVIASVDPDTFIRHNPAFPGGRLEFLDDIESGIFEGTRVATKRVFHDGEYVVTHNSYILAGIRMVGFDVFRFDRGRIVEHWDNLQTLAPPNPSGHTMLDGPSKLRDLDRTEENRSVVETLMKTVFIGGALDALPTYFSDDRCVQHNPFIGDGVTTLVQMLQTGALDAVYSRLHFVHARGDFVLAMSDGELHGERAAFYDLFRLENGRIAEHWDVVQAVPPESEWANDNGKF
jgi:predicted SnoaL-like aldol condensation-catalyzing enzyme